MLLLKKSLDLCDDTARVSALEAIRALVPIDSNLRPLLAHRIYCACKAQDAEQGYFKKSIPSSYWDAEEEKAVAEYRATRALGLNEELFSPEAEDALCDAFEALSGHLVEEQRR